MRRNSMLVVGVVLLAVFLMAVPQTALAKGKYKVTFGHVEPLESSTHIAALKIKELIEARTDGAMELSNHPTSELGPGPDQGQMTQTGAIHMAILPGAHIAGSVPEVQVFAIPFMFPGDLQEAGRVMNGPGADVLFKHMAKRDLIGLAVYPHAYKQFTSNIPVKVPDDFKGQKIRTMAAPIIVESYKLLGASPLPINYHEVYTALQLGTVDGEENPYWSIGTMKFYEVQKYIVESNHASIVTVFITNKMWFEGLPAEYQKIIREVAQEVIPIQIEAEEKIDGEWEEKIRNYAGTTVTELTPEAREAFRQKLEPVGGIYVKLVGANGREVLDAFNKDMGR